YKPPLKYLFKAWKRGVPFYQNFYRGCVLYADRWIGEVIAALEERGLDENTLVVLLSDHGDTFRTYHVKKGGGVKQKRVFDHGVGLYEEEITVPLLFKKTGLEPVINENKVQLLDVLPTLVGILGLPGEAPAKGISLLNKDLDKLKRTFYFSGRHSTGLLYEGRYKFICNTSPYIKNGWEVLKPQYELYDMEDDPFEEKNLTRKHPLLLRKLISFWTALEPQPREWKITFTGLAGTKGFLSGNFSDSGGPGAELDKKGRKLSFTVTDDPAEILFTQNDFPQPFFFYQDAVSPGLYRMGEFALPLGDKDYSINESELEFCRGIFSVLLPEERNIYLGWENRSQAGESLSEMPAQLKQTLKDWGYLHEEKEVK
ncbi:MAG TPA: sulfatase-like hydrolase/transferase, partial [bacterium]|nr:sulfatase-like hydrolase/transferase [bacterium]